MDCLLLLFEMPKTEDSSASTSSNKIKDDIANKWIKKDNGKEQTKVYINENESVSIEFENTEDDKRKFFEALKEGNTQDYDYTSDASSDFGNIGNDWLPPRSSNTDDVSNSLNGLRAAEQVKNLNDGASFGYSVSLNESQSFSSSKPKDTNGIKNMMERSHENSVKSRMIEPEAVKNVEVGTETFDSRPIEKTITPYIDTSSNSSGRKLLSSPVRPRKASKPKVETVAEQPSYEMENETDISISMQLESEADKLSRELQRSKKEVIGLEEQLTKYRGIAKEKDQELDENRERIAYFEKIIKDQKSELLQLQNRPDLKQVEENYRKQFEEQEILIKGVRLRFN